MIAKGKSKVHTANFYGFATGNENKNICHHIKDDVNSVVWYLHNYDKAALTDIIQAADLVIILSDLNEHSQVIEVELIIDIAQISNTPVLIYATNTIKLALQSSKQTNTATLLNYIHHNAIIVPLDRHALINSSEITQYFMQHSNAEDYSVLSMNLLITLKALVEPITQQALIGVDFADYQLALACKGYYHTSLYTAVDLTKANNLTAGWQQSEIIIVSIFLNTNNALEVFYDTSELICNILKKSNAKLLIAPIIDEYITKEPLVSITYKQVNVVAEKCRVVN